MNICMDILLEFLKLGIVGLIAGLFSAFLATRKHRNSKSWELKVAAYRSLIDNLSDLSSSYDNLCETYHYNERDTESNKEYIDGLSKCARNSFQEVRKAANNESFLYSKEINEALSKFMEFEKKDFHDRYTYMEAYSAGADTCRKKVIEAASKELPIKYSWL